MSQGRNPWSDVGALEALRVGGRCLARAVADPTDHAAREALAWAATLAGIAFGNAGVHLPHAMSYSVAGLVRGYHCPGYPAGEALVPHGVSVIVNAPSVFRATAATSPERHLAAASALGADPIEVRDASPDEVGELVARYLVQKMRATGVPLGVSHLGYGEGDLEPLARGAFIQKRLVDNAPMLVTEETMRALFRGAMAYG
jgi:alcohol dehydrogenase class IV